MAALKLTELVKLMRNIKVDGSTTRFKEIVTDPSFNVNELDNDGFHPLAVAATHRRYYCADYFLRNCQNLNVNQRILNTGATALHLTIGDDHDALRLLKLLIADPRTKFMEDFSGGTPLHNACMFGYLDAAKVLYTMEACKANLNSATLERHTALTQACIKGHPATVEWLMSLDGIDPNQKHPYHQEGKYADSFYVDLWSGPISTIELLVARSLALNKKIYVLNNLLEPGKCNLKSIKDGVKVAERLRENEGKNEIKAILERFLIKLINTTTTKPSCVIEKD